jgi:hypothetical protein
MRKLTALSVALTLVAAGEAFAGPPHAPTAHAPTAHGPAASGVRAPVASAARAEAKADLTKTLNGLKAESRNYHVQNLQELKEGLEERLSKIPTAAATAKAEPSPGEIEAKAAPVVEHHDQNAHSQKDAGYGVSFVLAALSHAIIQASGTTLGTESDAASDIAPAGRDQVSTAVEATDSTESTYVPVSEPTFNSGNGTGTLTGVPGVMISAD